MNHLVFNTVSSQLRTMIANATVTVAGDVEITNATVTVSGNVEISNASVTVSGDVEITNPTLTVAGEVSITGTASVEITNASLTVAGDVEITNTSITVAGSVEITNPTVTVEGEVTITGTASVEITNASLTVAGDVEITNTSITVNGSVTISGHVVVETNTLLEGVTGTGVALTDTDISQLTTGSFFVYNTGTNTFSISLQVSPTNDANLYLTDPDNENLEVAASGGILIAIGRYGRYARLLYDATDPATFSAYYIGQM